MTSGIRWDEATLKAYQARQLGINKDKPPAPKAPSQVAPAATPKESKIERRFAQQLADRPEIPAHQRNYFFLADRDFELDFAWPEKKVAVEIQGMSHRIKGKFKRDIEKRALAMLAGWRVLEVDGDSVRSGKGLEWLITLLGEV